MQKEGIERFGLADEEEIANIVTSPNAAGDDTAKKSPPKMGKTSSKIE